MQDFRNIDAWKKAHQLVLRIHQATQSFPREETFGVTSLLRRSSIFIATRIAEAYGKSTQMEKAVDLRKAAAATNELEYHILLARDLGHWSAEVAEEMTNSTVEVRKMIFGLLRAM